MVKGVHLDPSGSVIKTVLGSYKDAGKFVPVMVNVLPPWLFSEVEGLTELTVTNIGTALAAPPRGSRPKASTS